MISDIGLISNCFFIPIIIQILNLFLIFFIHKTMNAQNDLTQLTTNDYVECIAYGG